MKFKTTKKAMNKGFFTVSVGYCNLQDLLAYEEPVAYTSGVYGWNADIYTFGNIAIVTGYRPFGNVRGVDYEMIRKYETAAREIRCNAGLDYDRKKQAVQNLLADLLGEIRQAIRAK